MKRKSRTPKQTKTSDVERRAALAKLGAEALADTLIDLAPLSKEVDATIERLISSPQACPARFKDQLSNLSCLEEFVDWRGLSAFRRELEFLLAELKASGIDSRTGFELVISFFEADQIVFENCDDDGFVGDVFAQDAVELLAHFGSKCQDKKFLCEQLVRLYAQDPYGARGHVFDNACQYLPKEDVLRLIEGLREQQTKESDRDKYRWIMAIESLARQLPDPELFEQSRRGWRAILKAEDICEIAGIWIEAGDAERALSVLQQAEGAFTNSNQFNHLMLLIHKKLGNRNDQAQAAWRIFRDNRCAEALKTLLETIGADKRHSVIEQQAREILECQKFSYSDAEFLVDCGCIDEAEKYLSEHAGQLVGGFYSYLVPLAKAMKKHHRYLIATILYRRLLDSILERGYTKAYHHGVDYLRELEGMAAHITSWEKLVPHAGYVSELRISHGRKSSFWGQCAIPANRRK